jgi:hypothetical protein
MNAPRDRKSCRADFINQSGASPFLYLKDRKLFWDRSPVRFRAFKICLGLSGVSCCLKRSISKAGKSLAATGA